MEVKALHGMKEIISRSPNLVIMVEWQFLGNQRRNMNETMDILNFLAEKGYNAYSYEGGDVN